jgi:hypothetical protein
LLTRNITNLSWPAVYAAFSTVKKTLVINNK